jgi:hypothetical protein
MAIDMTFDQLNPPCCRICGSNHWSWEEHKPVLQHEELPWGTINETGVKRYAWTKAHAGRPTDLGGL